MTAGNGTHAFSPASLLCRDALTTELLATSESNDWRSVFVEHHDILSREEPFETRSTPDQTLVVMTRGQQELESLQAGRWRRATYAAGTMGTTPGGMSDRLRRRIDHARSPARKVNLYIPQSFFEHAAEDLRRAGQSLPNVELNSLAFEDPVVTSMVGALLHAMTAGALDIYAQTAMQWLAIHLLTTHEPSGRLSPSRRATGRLTDRRLTRVFEYMSAHYASSLQIDDLAREAGISKFHFTRLFREATGSNPHAALVELRLNEAKRLLVQSDGSVKEIAAACGFTRAAHFGTLFRKRLGVSPAAYRQRERGM